MKTVSAPEHTREQLRTLIEGRLGTAATGLAGSVNDRPTAKRRAKTKILTVLRLLPCCSRRIIILAPKSQLQGRAIEE